MLCLPPTLLEDGTRRRRGQTSDVNKDWTCKDKDKDFTYSYLLQVAAKPTIAIKQQQWTQSESSQHVTVKTNPNYSTVVI